MFYFSIVKMYCFWVLLVLVATVLGDDCDKKGVLVYEDLGCTPAEKPKNGSCPEKFECPNLVSTATTCAYRGRLYEDKEYVNDTMADLSCNLGCFCKVDSERFECASLDCPPDSQYPFPPNCYPKYTLDGCCASGSLCLGKDDIATCEFNGETYNEGNLFYPENTCLVCVCQKGFNGTLEAPYCRKKRCGTQLTIKSQFVEKKCAPIYFPKSALCCPDNWACANGTEIIEGEVTSENLKCQFGDKIVKKGQTFEKTNIPPIYFGKPIEKVKCECSLPPLVTCHTV